MDVTIRPETMADHAAIEEVIARAFAPKPYADGDEQVLPDRFRANGALALSLVAERDGQIVGQVTLTPARAADGSTGWYGLGPIAVEPALQGQGIGGALIRAAIGWMRARDAAGCVLVGNPSYYSRFGWRAFAHLAPLGEPPEFFQILPLATADPASVIFFHPLFYGPPSQEAQ